MSNLVIQNLKKIMLPLILVIVIIGVIIFAVIEFKSYQYSKELKQVQSKYNDRQKECVCVGTTNNYIYVSRTDENENAIEGTEWEVTDDTGKKIGTFKTNQNGNGGIVGLEYGKYYLEEISVPENYTISQDRYRVIINKYDTSYTLKETSSTRKGSLTIAVKDNMGKEMANLSFDVFNNNDEKIATVTTKENGVTKVENFSDGIYYIRATDDKEAHKYTFYIKNASDERLDITYKENK